MASQPIDETMKALKSRSSAATLLCFAILVLSRVAAADPTLAITHGQNRGTFTDYQIFMWQTKTATQYASLKRIGITGAAMIVDRNHPEIVPPDKFAVLHSAGLPWYVENIATDFYSAYHRWFPDHPVDWQFVEAKTRYREDPGVAHTNTFVRDPSLSDPLWLNKIESRLTEVVKANRIYRPSFYNLADETGIADLNAPWDFDLSEASMREMRRWLIREYVRLSSLNREWGTKYKTWNQILPVTTDVAVKQADENFSRWADFKAWMDVAFSHAIRAGTDAVHRADGTARAGIEGVQLPGWGGYDFGRLAESVDVMEAPPTYFPLLRSLNEKLVLLNTSAPEDPTAIQQIWRAFLEGSNGIILWDQNNDLVDINGNAIQKNTLIAQCFAELRGGIGSLVINSAAEIDPIAILYSQASMRTEWIRYWRTHGGEWAIQDTDSQNRDNPWRGSMRRYFEGIVRIGLRPKFITDDRVALGGLRSGIRVLILPDAVALSRGAAKEIEKFLRHGGTVIADREPGIFDEHSRKLTVPLLHFAFRHAGKTSQSSIGSSEEKAVYLPPPPDPTEGGEVDPKELEPLRRIFQTQGIRSEIEITTKAGRLPTDIAIYRFRNGPMTIIGLDRMISETATALRPRGDASTREALTVRFSKAAFIYDLRAHRLIGRTNEINVTLDDFGPKLFALVQSHKQAPGIRGPVRLARGERGVYQIVTHNNSARGLEFVHIELRGPTGQSHLPLSPNVPINGRQQIAIQFGTLDSLGAWTLGVTDVVTGETVNTPIEVLP